MTNFRLSKTSNVLLRYDLWRSKFRSEQKIKHSYKRIGQIVTKELLVIQELHPSFEVFKIHLKHPISGRWSLKDNEWCLYPFVGNFHTNKIHKFTNRLMWAKYHKHPAYAIEDMTIQDSEAIAMGIASYIASPGRINVEVNSYVHKGEKQDRVSIVVTLNE